MLDPFHWLETKYSENWTQQVGGMAHLWSEHLLVAEVRQAFSFAFHNFVNIDLPGGWLLVEAVRR